LGSEYGDAEEFFVGGELSCCLRQVHRNSRRLLGQQSLKPACVPAGFHSDPFVDRINIGFAALTMNKELAMTGQQFGFAAGVFFFGYCLFEVPSGTGSSASKAPPQTGETLAGG
jgi:hypothetical protein